MPVLRSYTALVGRIERLVKSICRFLSPEDALCVEVLARESGYEFCLEGSKSLGGVYVLKVLWDML